MRTIKLSAIGVLIIVCALIFAPYASAATPESSFTFDAATGTITGFTGSEAEVDIPATIGGVPVVKIGASAFMSKPNLISVSMPSSVTAIDEWAISKCENLTSITLPLALTELGSNALRQNPKLTSITLPEGLKALNGYTFYGCSSLTSIVIPKSVTYVGGEVFAGCVSLTAVSVADGNERYSSFGEMLFNKDKTTLLVSANLSNVVIPETVTTIGNTAFLGNSALIEVSLPMGLKKIGERVFYGCKKLEFINLPPALESIGSGAFNGCTALTSVSIPASVKTIGNYAFAGCAGLEAVLLPENLGRIENYTFIGCRKLSAISIPASVNHIGERAFSDCIILTKAEFLGEAPDSFERYVFQDVKDDFVITYLPGFLNWTSPTWKGYPTVMNAEGTVSYNSNGGSDVKSIVVQIGEAFEAPETPVKYGNSFIAWYRDKALTNEWNFTTDTLQSGALTLYAKWAANTYDITYNLNGGTGVPATSSYTYGVGITLPIPTRTSHTFGGWYTDSGFISPRVTVITADDMGDKTLWAKWTPNTYTITYNLNGGTAAAGTPSRYTHKVGAALPIPIRIGYKFGGWFTNSNFSGSAVSAITTADTGNKTYYAKWTAAKSSVVKFTNGKKTTSKTVKYSAKTAAPKVTKKGYKLMGWYTKSGVKFNPAARVTKGATYTARWYSTNKYLSKLSASTGTWKPRFSKTKYSYRLTIPAKKSSVKVTARKADTKAKIYWSTNKTTWKAGSAKTIKLKKGQSKYVYFKVVSQSKSLRVTTVKITRKK